jgi:hypothetical protein
MGNGLFDSLICCVLLNPTGQQYGGYGNQGYGNQGYYNQGYGGGYGGGYSGEYSGESRERY